MWGEETSPDGLGDEFVEDECSVLRSGLPVGMFRFSCPSLFKLRCQPTSSWPEAPKTICVDEAKASHRHARGSTGLQLALRP